MSPHCGYSLVSVLFFSGPFLIVYPLQFGWMRRNWDVSADFGDNVSLDILNFNELGQAPTRLE